MIKCDRCGREIDASCEYVGSLEETRTDPWGQKYSSVMEPLCEDCQVKLARVLARWRSGEELSGDAMSVSEAASELGVNRQRVHQLLASGKLEGRKSGSMWLVDAESVKRRLHDGR